MSRRTKALTPLLVWTLFVWSSRIRNIWTDDSLSTGGQVLRTVFAVVFLVFAVSVAVRLWQLRGAPFGRGDRVLLSAFLVWTVGFWLVRGIGIIVDDHTVGFTVIHTVLMAISIGLAVVAARVLPARSISSSRLAAR